MVARQCGAGTLQWESAEFDMPARGALERWRAAAHIESVAVVELVAADVSEAAPSPGRVAGVRVASGSEVPLSADGMSKLATWLHTAEGFDDKVVRRCKRGQAFGFRVRRKPPQLEAETSEVAIDFACNSIAVVNQEGMAWRRADAFFDASRPVLLGILKAAVPVQPLPER